MKKTLRADAGFYVFAALLALLLVCRACVPGFHHAGMYFNILTQASITGILAIGMLFVLICGNIDLSIGAQTSLYGVLCVYLMKQGIVLPVAMLLTMACALLIGGTLGWLIQTRRLNSMVATIAAAVTLQGVTYIVARGLPLFNIPGSLERMVSAKLGRFSFCSLLFAGTVLLAGLILHHTYWGKFFYALGSDEHTAQRAGVPVRRTRMLAFALCSLLCACGAIAFTGRIGLASLDAGGESVLDVMTAAALGGVGFQGGRGKILPVVCATLLLATLSTAFIGLRTPYYYQNLIKGGILFLAISTKITKS